MTIWRSRTSFERERSSARDNRLPESGAGFVWDDIGGERSVPVLRPATTVVKAAFTTRIGGTSESPFDELNLSFRVGDAESHARTNREVAGRAIGRDGSWSVVRQVHGADLVPAAAPGELADADGMFTEDAERTLAVLAADCVPVLLVSTGRMAVAHAGWRGLVGGILERAVEAAGRAPAVFAGPAIGPCCYQVGEDVAEAFAERFGGTVISSDRRIDLWTSAEIAATRAGASAFAAARVCTSCNVDLFFSHRRDRGRTGRQALIARLAS